MQGAGKRRHLSVVRFGDGLFLLAKDFSKKSCLVCLAQGMVYLAQGMVCLAQAFFSPQRLAGLRGCAPSFSGTPFLLRL